MPLSTTDIRIFKPSNISDTAANGGVMTNVELTDVVGALFANVDNTERTTGSTKWRKMFFKLHNDGLSTLLGTRVYLDRDTDGDDTILFAAGTMDNVQGTLGTPKLYGSYSLKNSVVTGGTTVKYQLPNGVDNTFDVGDTIRITNKATYAGAGNEEFIAITDAAVNAGEVTLTLATPLVNSYTSSAGRIMGVFNAGDVVAMASNLIVNSPSGAFDIQKVVCNNRSTIFATWTITFTSATTFDVSSNVTGAIQSGNTFSVYAPNNSAYSLPFFSVSGAFSGTFETGNTVTFSTAPAAIPVWMKRVVPVGSNPIAVNKATFVIDGGTV